MLIMAIDPGNIDSAYALIESEDCRAVKAEKVDNATMMEVLRQHPEVPLYIEMVASYGMAVGAEVFDTCVWIGRFMQINADLGGTPEQVFRRHVKLHHCHDSRAKDGNITRALADRFARGQKNFGKGTKKNPGWFYGFAADIWQAYALAVYAADMRHRRF